MKTFDDKYPYSDAETVFIKPLAKLMDGMGDEHGFLPSWEGPPLVSPLAHCCLQPLDALKKACYQDLEKQVEQFLWLAFQFGICQGHAMRDGEVSDYKLVIEKFAAQSGGSRWVS